MYRWQIYNQAKLSRNFLVNEEAYLGSMQTRAARSKVQNEKAPQPDRADNEQKETKESSIDAMENDERQRFHDASNAVK